MKEIKPRLTNTLQNHFGDQLSKSEAYSVNRYSDLLTISAELSYLNKNTLIFYRGQDEDYRNRAGASTLYPSIYRGERIQKEKLEYHFSLLDEIGRLLADEILPYDESIAKEIRRKKLIQWSIIQHYEITKTPLLDITQSLRVACSFAQIENDNNDGCVYFLGLPFIHNGVAHDSEDEIINIRLLSVCPPIALRPYFQEGYLIGTTDITTDFDSKSDLDFNRRLIAKFKIPNNKSFWDMGVSKIAKEYLYPDPKRDKLYEIYQGIYEKIQNVKDTIFENSAYSEYLDKISSMMRNNLNKKRNDNKIK